jgi:hypothetical protein
MDRRPLLVVIKEMVKSPVAWLLPFATLAGIYSTVRREYYPDLPSLGLVMPHWAWLVIILTIALAASFHANYKLAKSNLPSLRSDVIRLFEKRRMQGFEIRKKALPGWDERAFEWYRLVLSDLALIRGQDFSTLFDHEIGRKPKIKNAMNEKDPRAVVNITSDELLKLQTTITNDEILQTSELAKHLRSALD